MKIKYLLLFILLFKNICYAQTDTADETRNMIYVEAAGTAGIGSLQYERVLLTQHRFFLSASIGLSTYRITDYNVSFNPDLIMPLLIHGCMGSNQKIEIAAGLTGTSIVHASNESYSTYRSNEIHSVFVLGYRFQKKSDGFIFRCSYTPIFENNQRWIHWAGISFGYAF